jgi:hypothetical protein
MLSTLLLIAALEAAATPTATQTPAPTPVPVLRANADHPRTLADVARERKLGIKPKAGGFSAAESTVGPPMHPQDKEDAANPQKKLTLSKLGEPERRNITTTFDAKGSAHVTEQWIYPNGVYVYFSDGRITAVQK